MINTSASVIQHRALVVDDDKICQFVVKNLLEELGYNVTLANDGSEAIELVKSNLPYEFITMDIDMPVLNGLEATKVIRSTENKKVSKIVGLSAHTTPDMMQMGLQAGMDVLIAKPVSLSDFKKLIQWMEK